MTLEEIFYVSQSIASLAVVGSLIYLGLQVRYAERSQRGIMQQGRADRTSQASLAMADPVLARFGKRGWRRSGPDAARIRAMDDDLPLCIPERRRLLDAAQGGTPRPGRL